MVLTEKKIYTQHKSDEFDFLGGLIEDYSLGDSLQIALKNCPKRWGQGGGQYIYIYMILVKGIPTIRHVFQ